MKRAGFFLLGILTCAGCYLDPFGLIGTLYPVHLRFYTSTNMAGFPDTIVSNSNDFSFIHITDTHYYEGTNIHLGKLLSHLTTNDAFVINTGDLVNTGRVEEYQDYITHMSNLGLPFYSAIGNHDLWHAGWEHYPHYIGPSVYTFRAGNIRFISLDSANATLGWEQVQWLKLQLQFRSESLCVIMMHFNLLLPHVLETGQFADMEEVYHLMFLFENYGVDLVLMGHTHNFDDRTINGVRYLTGEELKQVPPQQKEYNRIHIKNEIIQVERVIL